jgi:hypothetical protein
LLGARIKRRKHHEPGDNSERGDVKPVHRLFDNTLSA